MPEAVQDIFGYALFLALAGGKHHQAKPPGLWVPGVLEVVEEFDKDTLRPVYTVSFANAVDVLHCFK